MLDDDTLYSNEEVIPFPETGDALFSDEIKSYYHAQIHYSGHNHHDTLYRYVIGYKEAADRLVQSLMEERHHIDFVVFPIVFLYRQYLELRLKQLLIEGNKLIGKSFVLPKHHRLDTLWYECKGLLKQIEPSMTEQETAVLEARILEFSTLDPISMAFRYHVDTHDNSSLPPSLQRIDVINFSNIMAKIDSFLDATYMAITVSFEQKMEMEEAFKDYYPSEEDWGNYYGMPDRYEE